MKSLHALKSSEITPGLWFVRFFLIAVTLGFSIFSPVSSGLPETFKTELHERARDKVTVTTFRPGLKRKGKVREYPQPTNDRSYSDSHYDLQLKTFRYRRSNPPARLGHHPRHPSPSVDAESSSLQS